MSRILRIAAGLAAMAVVAVMVVGQQDAQRLTMSASAEVWGAGGGCSKTELSTTNGCSGTNCRAAANAETDDDTGDQKIVSENCNYSSGGTLVNCGTISTSYACDQ